MGTETLRGLVERLGASSRALAAVGAALQARAGGAPPDPAVRAALDDVLDALGARRLVDDAPPEDLRPVLGAVRTELFLAARLVSGDGPPAAGGWSDAAGPAALRAAGDVSAGFPAALERAVAPELDGLAGRLAAPGASFLDVGTGVAAMAIAMARRWPSLRVVGIDPLAASIALARADVRAAGLEDRMELREQKAEDLPDEDRFDLAWIPGAFVPERALPLAAERVRRALRPGGWLLLAFAAPGADPLATALSRLRAALWGGSLLAPAGLQDLLARSGFADIKALPGPPGAAVGMIAARRGPGADRA